MSWNISTYRSHSEALWSPFKGCLCVCVCVCVCGRGAIHLLVTEVCVCVYSCVHMCIVNGVQQALPPRAL